MPLSNVPSMRIYLDDDSIELLLIRFLRQGRHDVQLPADVALRGSDDAVHLTHSIHEDRVMITRNYRDFENLHNLIAEAKGHHSGMLVVRRDNDARRNMKPHDIVRAIQNLVASGLPVADSYHELNQWR